MYNTHRHTLQDGTGLLRMVLVAFHCLSICLQLVYDFRFVLQGEFHVAPPVVIYGVSGVMPRDLPNPFPSIRLYFVTPTPAPEPRKGGGEGWVGGLTPTGLGRISTGLAGIVSSLYSLYN